MASARDRAFPGDRGVPPSDPGVRGLLLDDACDRGVPRLSVRAGARRLKFASVERTPRLNSRMYLHQQHSVRQEAPQTAHWDVRHE